MVRLSVFQSLVDPDASIVCMPPLNIPVVSKPETHNMTLPMVPSFQQDATHPGQEKEKQGLPFRKVHGVCDRYRALLSGQAGSCDSTTGKISPVQAGNSLIQIFISIFISFRALFLFLAFLLAFTMLPTSVHAASGTGDVQFVQDVGPVLFPGQIEGFENSWDGWEADNGVWEIGEPTSGPPADAQGNRAYEGVNVLATVLSGNYTDDRTSRIMSPAFTVPAAGENPRLRFWHWWSISGHDFGKVQISTNNGTTWTDLSAQYTADSSGQWTRATLDLSAYAGQTVRIGFYFESHGYDTWQGWRTDVGPGWHIDQVEVLAGSLPEWPDGGQDNFEDPAAPDRWKASHGIWEIGASTSGPPANAQGNRAHEGTAVLATILSGNYTDDRTSRIMSPALTVPAAGENPRLRFWHWWSIATTDFGSVQVSTDNGTTWTDLSGKYTADSSEQWTRATLDLSAYAGQTVRIGFYFESHGYDTWQGWRTDVGPGWYIDQVEMLTGSLPQWPVGGLDTFEDAAAPDRWTASNGIFEIGMPTSGPPANAQGNRAHKGVNVLATVLSSNYTDDRTSRIMSPAFTVPAAGENPRLRFWHWWNISGYDFGKVQISTDNGVSWKDLSGQFINDSNEQWTRITLDLNAYAGQNVRIGFYFETHGYDTWQGHFTNVGPGWYIDEIELRTGPDRFSNPEDFEALWGNWDTDNFRVWQIGVPTSGPTSVNGSRAHSPVSVAATVLGGNYAANTTGRLISPRFTVPSVAGDDRVILRFWQWYQYGAGDSGTLQVKGAYDTDWVTLLQAAPTGSSSGWQLATVDLTAYQGQEVLFAFLHAANDDSSVGAGWYIDDVSLSQSTPGRLNLDGVSTQQFTANRQSQYYVVKVPPGGHLRVDFKDQDNQGNNELYVRRGALPTPGSYDYKFKTAGASQSVFVPNAGAGDWFVLAYNDSGPLPGDYTLQPVISYGVALESLDPVEIGNSVPGTVTISGAGFTPNSKVSLKRGGTSYPASDIAVVSGSSIIADFDFTKIPAGNYALHVAEGTSSAELPFNVFAGGEPKLTTKIIVPKTVGYHNVATLWVEFTNDGNAAMPAPVLEVSGIQNGRRAAILTLDASRLVQGFWTSAVPEGFANSVQFMAHGRTPGLLQPGESGRVPIYYTGWQQPWDFNYSPIKFELGVLTSDNVNAIDWASLKDFMRPSSMTDEQWTPVFANLKAQTGTTWGDYVRMLNDNARYLAKLGQTVTDIRDLLAFEVIQASGLSLSRTLTSAVDGQVQTPGLPLTFTRSFGADLPSRFTLGRLGRGWSDNWDYSLAVATDGTVMVLGPNGSRRVFQPDSRSSSYFSESGDYGTLTKLNGGEYSMTESDGTVYAFRTDGKLDYLQDTHGNRITAVWTGDHLTRLAHSAGPHIDLAYNGPRIASVIDSLGRQTTFAYDASVEHLQSATDYRGQTTTYGYGQGADDQHALTLIRQPDGIESHYTYDGNGRLFKKAGCCGSPECTTYTYDAAGKITATDALGNASQFYLDHRGPVGRTVNALGNVNSRTYDSIGRLIQSTDPAGRFITYAYHERGNLSSETDALGYTTRYNYTTLNHLSTLIDAKGNVTRYAYESDGDLASITYADGSRENWAYDANGNRLSWTNRRGQTINYVNDALGRLIERHYPDGVVHTFTYDAQGNLTSYTDPLGTTTQEIDADGRLAKITYPGDRWLSYTYDTGGRRASMTDQLGHRSDYHYDAQGRLESLTDEANTEIVHYAYDAAGRMSRKTLGNGVYTTYTYDSAGQLLELSNLKPDGSILSQLEYTYDSRGRRDTMTTTYGAGDPRAALAGQWIYNYDDTGQLIGWTAPDGRRVDYTYDALGNRLNVRDNGVDTAYTVNNLNQYTKVGETTYQYDADGNLFNKIAPEGKTSYGWSFENRLVQVTGPSTLWQNGYDAQGNRTRVAEGGLVKDHVIDPAGLGNVVGEYMSEAVSPLTVFTHGGGLVSRRTGSESGYYTFDALGSTSELEGSSGKVSNAYAYLPFGELLFHNELETDDFQFVGEAGVMAKAGAMSFMRARHYGSIPGRFISPDPAGILASDVNLYRYVKNNPLSLIDPTGLYCDDTTWPTSERKKFCKDNGGTWICGIEFPTLDCKACWCLYPRNSSLPPNNPTCLMWKGITETAGAGTSATSSDDCGNGGSGTSGVARPTDPNNLLGPSGYGPANYVQSESRMPYAIHFENESTATAPAQNVTVSNPLAANFDLSTFELTEVAFADHFIAVPPGTQHYTSVEKMTYNGVSFEVQIEAGIRLATGEVYAKFTSLDPVTGLPPTVDIGFLPPENGTGRGQGHVSYVVKQKAGLPTGVESRNIARIVFDGQPAIATNLVDPHDASKGTDPAKEALVTNWTAPLPIVATGAATGITTASATLNGQLSPNDYPTTALFEYGLTTAYGNTANATATPATGTTLVEVSAAISGLQPGVTYHYRLNASNSLGNWLGDDATFTVQGQVSKAGQIITFGSPPTVYVGGTGALSATGGGSGNSVVFTAQTPGVCTVSGNIVTGVAAGTCTITANQAGNADYNAAPQAIQTFPVGKGKQTISFGFAPVVFAGKADTVSATGGASGNPVIFTSQTPNICSVAGSTVTIAAEGTCTIAADQSGNADYNAATQVTQSFNVTFGVECLFNWAEASYPGLFSPAGAISQYSSPYTYRYYSSTYSYVGASSADSHLYYLGPDGIKQDVGDLPGWLTPAGCTVIPPPPEKIECLFDWAEASYPGLLSPVGAISRYSSPYTYRYYKDTQSYVGVSDANSHVYYLGPDDVLQDVGDLPGWLTKSGCY